MYVQQIANHLVMQNF